MLEYVIHKGSNFGKGNKFLNGIIVEWKTEKCLQNIKFIYALYDKSKIVKI